MASLCRQTLDASTDWPADARYGDGWLESISQTLTLPQRQSVGNYTLDRGTKIRQSSKLHELLGTVGTG